MAGYEDPTEEELKALEPYLSDEDEEALEKEIDLPERPPFHESRILVVDGLPIIEEKRVSKLKKYLKRVFSQFGDIASNGIYMPLNDENRTEGFCFVEFVSDTAARNAQVNADGAQFDDNHVIAVNFYSDIEKFTNVPDELPEPSDIKQFDHLDLDYWIKDPTNRDQYVIRYSDETEIYWAETRGHPTLHNSGTTHKERGLVWTEQQVMWSPRGSYFATFHPPGVKLWGGPEFEDCGRFIHQGVRTAVFSPCERFLATTNPDDQARAIVVFDVRTGIELRPFKLNERDDPVKFGWSQDGKYFARLNVKSKQKMISVHRTPDMSLHNKSSVRAPGAVDLSWCPARRNILAWWAPEREQVAASVTLMEFPSRQILRQKNEFNVDSCTFHWQEGGNYLCVQMQRKSGRKGNVTFTSFVLFRLAEKGIPVEMLEFREPVVDFCWEPYGHRFGIIYGEGPQKYSIEFYSMKSKSKSHERLRTLQSVSANKLVWSPAGSCVVMAGMRQINGTLAFYDVDNNVVMNTSVHPGCNLVRWDPFGRIVATCKEQAMTGSVSTRDQVQNGYILHDCQGNVLYRIELERFYQFMWRPYPRDLITKEDEKYVKKHLKEISAKYGEEDRRVRDAKRYKLLWYQRQQRDAFYDRLRQLASRWEQLAERRAALDVLEDREEDYNEAIVKRKEVLSERTEPVDETEIQRVVDKQT